MATTTAKKATVMNFSEVDPAKPKILGFSGKLEAGKDSACNFLYALAMVHVLKNEKGEPLTDYANVNEVGKLVVNTTDGIQEFDVDSEDPDVRQYLANNVWGFIKKFSCADYLKRFCVDVLGLSNESVYGTNDQKNQPTHLRWEDMPVPVYQKDNILYYGHDWQGKGYEKRGQMTGREVMEYFGTNIVRKMNSDSWANALGVSLDRYASVHKLVKDIRFENEVDVIHSRDGKVIRFTRTTPVAAKNKTESNIALDNYSGFDAVIDNQNCTMEEMFGKLIEVLMDFGWFSYKEIEVR